MMEEAIVDHNPWSSGNISEFLFYNCPECDVKEKDQYAFLGHALQNHTRARISLSGKNHDEEHILIDQTDLIEESKDEQVDIAKNNGTFSDQDQIDQIPSKENHVGRKRDYDHVKEIEYQQIAKRHRTDIKSQCYLCGIVLCKEDANDLKNSMIAHISENHSNCVNVTPKMYGEIRFYQCKDCLLMFSNKYNCQAHSCGHMPTSWLVVDHKSPKVSVMKKKSTMIQCYFCGEIVSSESELQMKNHIMDNHSSFVSAKMYGDRRTYQCSDCNRMFKTPQNLEVHVCGILPQSWLGPDQKSQKCPKCDQEFIKYGELLCHFNFDHKEDSKDQNYPCLHPQCQKTLSDQRISFKSRFELSLHAGKHKHLCDHCGKEYYSGKALQIHNRKCFGKDVPEDNPLECLYCSKVFPDLEIIHKHKNKVHANYYSYYEPACKQCKFRATSKKELYEHCKKEHRLICFECHEVFLNRSDLKMHHYQKHNSEKNVLCDSCDFTCALLIELDEHKKTVHDKIFDHVCNICGKGFKELRQMTAHIESVHINAKPVMCDKCNYRCNFMHQLTKHKKTVHEDKNHFCDTCGKGYYSKSDLNRHVKQTHTEGHFECKYCKVVYKTPHGLLMHKREKHQKFMICTKCDNVFIGRNALKEHIANEHAIFCPSLQDVWMCMKCDRRFETTSKLNDHLSGDHSFQQAHNCTQCDEVFVTKTILTSHLMEVHSFDPTKEDGISLPNIERKKVESDNAKVGKNFQCGVCGAYLKSKRTLSDHTKQKHQKETHRFFCTQCDWSTFESTRLKMHIKNSHPESPFECDQCDYKVNSLLKMRFHKRSKHSDKPIKSKILTCPQCHEKFTCKNAVVKLKKHCLNQHQLLVEVGNLMNGI